MAKYLQYNNSKGSFWEVRGYLGTEKATGKRKKIKKRGFPTKKHAQEYLNKKQFEFDKNINQNINDITFKQLFDEWIAFKRLSVKPSTLSRYKQYAKQFECTLFKLKINDITVAYAQKLVNAWADDYKTYVYIRKIAKSVMAYAERMEYIEKNVFSKTMLPNKTHDDKRVKYLTKNELFELLEVTKQKKPVKLFTLFHLLAYTGLRKSEALALQWKDIDFTKKTLTVSKTVSRSEDYGLIINTPKTLASADTLKIDDNTLAILKRWKATQAQLFLFQGLNVNKPTQFIFTNAINELLHPQNVNKYLESVYNLLPSDFTRITAHGFRHTHATLMLASGATMKEVSERLRHKNINITMDTYAHVLPEKQEKALENFTLYMAQ
jgi:integrase